jgi:HAD superfamily hydrolase (TIGR01509 family)
MGINNKTAHKKASSSLIQAVIFDLDGVLMDSEWIAFLVWQDLVASKGGRLEEADFPGMIGLTAEETAVYVMHHTGVSLDIAESVAWTWEEVSRRINQDIDPLPGARELVHTLAERGYPLAIASNSPYRYIESAISVMGLLPYFNTRVGIDMVAQGKPAPDVYLEAARQLGIAPHHCMAIEDSRVGMQAALNAGMRVLAVPGKQDHLDGYHTAWGLYRNLCEVHDNLEQALQ